MKFTAIYGNNKDNTIFGIEVLILKKRCLFIIDMQVGFINENTVNLPAKIADFIENNPVFDSIIATRYLNNPETACYKLGGWKECMTGTADAEISPILNKYIQKIFDKKTYSGFTEELRRFIRKESFDKIYFCGVNTDCCVLATVFSCYDSVLDCAVIADLCGSTLGEKAHNNAIQLLMDNITTKRIVNSKELSKIFQKYPDKVNTHF